VKDAGLMLSFSMPSVLNVAPCTGALYCWHKKLGECYQKDDMQMLYPKLRESDILVLADSGVYSVAG